MAIFHFKHSYLNWRVFSWLLFRADRIFQVHDMTINFSFSFSCFFDFSTPDNDTCHRWPSKLKHFFSMWGLFWKVGLLAQGCLGRFCPKRGSWLKSISKKWVILVNMSQDINQRWFQGIADLRFCSARGKGLAGLKLLASLDAYQITKYQFFFFFF